MSDQEKSWQTYAIAAMGAVVLAVSGLWINGVLNNIELVRQGIETQSVKDKESNNSKIEDLKSDIDIIRREMDQRSTEDRKTYNEKIDNIRSDFQRMYSDFGTVRNEQMQRTGRLTALETKMDTLLPAIDKRLSSAETDISNLKRK